MEIRSLFNLTACMSVFGMVASSCAPFMTTIAFGVLVGVD